MTTRPEPELVALLRLDGVKLRPAAGDKYRGLCPFHHDTKPSFEVYRSKRGYWWYRCRSTACNAHGNTSDYRQHTGRPDEQRPGRETPSEAPPSYKPVTAELHARAMEHYNELLLQYPEAVNYLQRRGVDPQQAHRLGIGYAPGNTLYRILQSELTPDEIETCPLLSSKRREDRAARRIIFPHAVTGDIPWHTARAIDLDSPLPYLSLPGRRPPLLMLRENKAAPPRSVIITEGPFDLLATLAAGHHGAATAGNPRPDTLRDALRRAGYRRIYVLPDRDQAGDGWVTMVTQPAREAGADPLLLTLPTDYRDPAETLLQRRPGPAAVYGAMLRNPSPAPQPEPETSPTTTDATTAANNKENPTMTEYLGAPIRFFGNLTNDPVDRGDPNRERPLEAASFRVAKNFHRYSSQEGRHVEQVAFYECFAMGNAAREVLSLRSGALLWVEGHHQPREYTGNDGQPRVSQDIYVTDINARIDYRPRENQGGQQQGHGQNYGNGGQQSSRQPDQSQQGGQGYGGPPPAGQDAPFDVDDLPF